MNPVPVVSCLVRNSKGNLLLIKRGIEPEKGKWALPGGFQEVNETSEEAGRRELFEETGVKGEVVRLVGVHVQPSKTYGQVLMVGYEYKALNKTLKVGDDAADTKYFPKNKLPKIPFKSQRKLIKQFYN